MGNFDADARWRFVEEMRSDPPVPARVGVATHEVLRFMGSTYVTDAAVTSDGPGHRLAFAGGEGSTVRGYRRVEEAPGGARFVRGLEIRLSGPVRLLEPLLARLYARRMWLEVRAPKALLERPYRAGDDDPPLVRTRAALAP